MLNHYTVDLEDPQELGEYIGKRLADLVIDNDKDYPESGFGHDVDHAWDIYIEFWSDNADFEEAEVELKKTWTLAQKVLDEDGLKKAKDIALDTALQIIKQYLQ